MSDSAYIIDQLDLSNTTSKLLAIVANERGALDACSHSSLSFLGFPFSISEKYSKNLVVYLSMGFGNPYGEPWNYEIVEKWIDKLSDLKIQVISLSDTIGTAVPDDIFRIFSNIIPKYTQVEFGAHFHTKPDDWFKKIDSAYRAGCKRFDGAIQGFGGCPMAKDELTGNLPTEKLISYFNSINKKPNINSLNFESCYNHALRLFNDFK